MASQCSTSHSSGDALLNLSEQLYKVRRQCIGAEERSRLSEAIVSIVSRQEQLVKVDVMDVNTNLLQEALTSFKATEEALIVSKATEADLRSALSEASAKVEKAENERRVIAVRLSASEEQLRLSQEQLQKVQAQVRILESSSLQATGAPTLPRIGEINQHLSDQILTLRLQLLASEERARLAGDALAMSSVSGDCRNISSVQDSPEVSILKKELQAVENRAEALASQLEQARGALASKDLQLTKKEIDLAEALAQLDAALPTLAESEGQLELFTKQVHEQGGEIHALKSRLQAAQENVQLSEVDLSDEVEGRALGSDVAGSLTREMSEENVAKVLQKAAAAEASLGEARKQIMITAKEKKEVEIQLQKLKEVLDDACCNASYHEKRANDLAEQLILHRIHALGVQERVFLAVGSEAVAIGHREAVLEQRHREALEILMEEIEFLREETDLLVQKLNASEARETQAAAKTETLKQELSQAMNEVVTLKAQLAQAASVGNTADVLAIGEINRKVSEELQTMKRKVIAAEERARLAGSVAGIKTSEARDVHVAVNDSSGIKTRELHEMEWANMRQLVLQQAEAAKELASQVAILQVNLTEAAAREGAAEAVAAHKETVLTAERMELSGRLELMQSKLTGAEEQARQAQTGFSPAAQSGVVLGLVDLGQGPVKDEVADLVQELNNAKELIHSKEVVISGQVATIARQQEIARVLADQLFDSRQTAAGAEERLRLVQVSTGTTAPDPPLVQHVNDVQGQVAAEQSPAVKVSRPTVSGQKSRDLGEKEVEDAEEVIGFREYEGAVLERDEARGQVAALEREVQASESKQEALAAELKAARTREDAAIVQKVGLLKELAEAKAREPEGKGGGAAAGLAVLRKQHNAALQREREEAKRQQERGKERQFALEAELAAAQKELNAVREGQPVGEPGAGDNGQSEPVLSDTKSSDGQVAALSQLVTKLKSKLEVKEKEVADLHAELEQKRQSPSKPGQLAAAAAMAEVMERLKTEAASLRVAHKTAVREKEFFQLTAERNENKAKEAVANEDAIRKELLALQGAKRELERRGSERLDEQLKSKFQGAVAREKEEAFREEREKARAVMAALEEEVDELKKANEGQEAEISELRRKYETAVEELEQLRLDVKSGDEKAQRLAVVVREKAAMEEKLRAVETSLKTVEEELREATEGREEGAIKAKEDLKQVRKQLERERKDLAEARKQVQEFNELVAVLEKAQKNEAEVMEALANEKAALAGEVDVLSREKDKAEGAVKGLEEELRLVGASDGKSAQEVASVRQQLEDTLQEKAEALGKVHQLELSLAGIQKQREKEVGQMKSNLQLKEAEIRTLDTQLKHIRRMEQAKAAELRKLSEMAVQEEGQLARMSRELEKLLIERKHWEAAVALERQRAAQHLQAFSAEVETTKQAEVSAVRAEVLKESAAVAGRLQQQEREVKKLKQELEEQKRALERQVGKANDEAGKVRQQAEQEKALRLKDRAVQQDRLKGLQREAANLRRQSQETLEELAALKKSHSPEALKAVLAKAWGQVAPPHQLPAFVGSLRALWQRRQLDQYFQADLKHLPPGTAQSDGERLREVRGEETTNAVPDVKTPPPASTGAAKRKGKKGVRSGPRDRAPPKKSQARDISDAELALLVGHTQRWSTVDALSEVAKVVVGAMLTLLLQRATQAFLSDP